MAQLSVAVKYGSNDDSEKKAGTAHFLEHMLVGGSQDRIKLQNEIERFGGYLNLETSDEFTFCRPRHPPVRRPRGGRERGRRGRRRGPVI